MGIDFLLYKINNCKKIDTKKKHGICRVSIGGLKVTGAQLSLITPDPSEFRKFNSESHYKLIKNLFSEYSDEQIIAAKSVTPFDGFNPVSKLHDIALIEV